MELFQGAQSEYNDVWRLVRVSFPYLCFHVLGPAGEALLGLLVDARNYPHRALSITLTDPSFNATATGVPGKPADTGRKGLVFNKEQQRHWFCTPGTDEYHTHYSGVEPFDRVRGDEKLDPLEVLLRCIRHIDLKELKAQLQQQAKGVGQTDRS